MLEDLIGLVQTLELNLAHGKGRVRLPRQERQGRARRAEPPTARTNSNIEPPINSPTIPIRAISSPSGPPARATTGVEGGSVAAETAEGVGVGEGLASG